MDRFALPRRRSNLPINGTVRFVHITAGAHFGFQHYNSVVWGIAPLKEPDGLLMSCQALDSQEWAPLCDAITAVPEARALYLDTWYLDEGFIELCIRPRRLRIVRPFDLEDFRQRALLLWSDTIVGGGPIRFVLVSPTPEGRRTTVAHVLIIKGRPQQAQGILLHGSQFPILEHTRAVLPRPATSARVILDMAQSDFDCHHPNVQCILHGPQPSNTPYVDVQPIFPVDGQLFEAGFQPRGMRGHHRQ